jgi:RND family efflux transporter MFP subunit
MRYTDSTHDPSPNLPDTVEEHLRRENENLRAEIEALRGGVHSAKTPPDVWQPSGTTIWAIALGVLVLLAIAFFGGYIPMQSRRAVIAAEAHEQGETLPQMRVIRVTRSNVNSDLALPGSIQPITEAPVLARTDGYIQRRLADIGDHVKSGQLLAEIDAPELIDQVTQAKAAERQAEAALDQATANAQQGKTHMELARIMAQRSGQLVSKGAVARQDDDQFQASYQSKLAALNSLEKAVEVQHASVAAAQSNLARLTKLQDYRMVVAPFEGVITLRNVDVGALVNSGSTMLFRIAQMDELRTFINVPQAYANSIRVGQAATLTVSNLPGRMFPGTVARTSEALDPSSRTLLAEIHVPNSARLLLPGMYTQVDFKAPRFDPPLVVPSDALIVRDNGAQVAVVRPGNTLHLVKIQAGRDYGDRVEVLGGLNEGDTVVTNPGDIAREGLKIDVAAAPAAAGKK